MVDESGSGAGWHQVGETGWLREEGIWILAVWRRRAGWVWRCHTKYPADERRQRNREGLCGSAEEARAAAEAALVWFRAQGHRR